MRIMRGRRPMWQWKKLPSGSPLNKHLDAAVSSSLRQNLRANRLGTAVIRDPRGGPDIHVWQLSEERYNEVVRATRAVPDLDEFPISYFLSDADKDLLFRATLVLDRGDSDLEQDAAETLAILIRSIANGRHNELLATRVTQLARHFAPDHDPRCDSDTCAPDCGVAKAKREGL
jgi:hypothetical protein